MNAPPTVSPSSAQRSPLALQLAMAALWLLIAINFVCFVCSIGAALSTSKSEGLLWGSIAFVLIFVAGAVALLALPAVINCRQVAWPRFALALGFTPLPVMAAVAQVIRWLRTCL